MSDENAQVFTGEKTIETYDTVTIDKQGDSPIIIDGYPLQELIDAAALQAQLDAERGRVAMLESALTAVRKERIQVGNWAHFKVTDSNGETYEYSARQDLIEHPCDQLVVDALNEANASDWLEQQKAAAVKQALEDIPLREIECCIGFTASESMLDIEDEIKLDNWLKKIKEAQ